MPQSLSELYEGQNLTTVSQTPFPLLVEGLDVEGFSAHVHFESIGPDGREIFETSHVYLTDP
jgi:hypothetical protein